MAPFGILEAGFCMVFRPACSLVFGPRDPFLDPRTKMLTQDFQIGPGLAWGGFGTKNGGPKNMVLRGDGFQIGDYGISRDPNGLCGTQEAFGKASFPPTPFNKLFPSPFPNFGELGKVPLSPPVYLLWALCGLLSLSNSRSTTRGGLYVKPIQIKS